MSDARNSGIPDQRIHDWYRQREGRGRPSVAETAPDPVPELTPDEREAASAEMHRVLGEYRTRRLNQDQFKNQ